ncbi:MAG: UDP-N-acetylenolpyruvoylglucosamine reductase, partial [Candidatus Portnoybacteria bacterium CG06_land_8_20_14_3_00_39_12]
YRDSVFKHNNEIILSADLALKKGEPEKIKQTIKDYLAQRQSKQPREPSAGSVFKNIQFDKLSKKLQDTIPTEKVKTGKVPAAYFIELAGLKGHQIGQAQISPKHSNFIVNLGGAKASDVLDLIRLVKNKVKEKFGIELEEEIQYIEF